MDYEEERRGYSIEIRGAAPEALGVPGAEALGEDAAAEVLRIDGEDVPFLRTSQGYRIYYQPPTPDLLSAARSFVDTQPEK